MAWDIVLVVFWAIMLCVQAAGLATMNIAIQGIESSGTSSSYPYSSSSPSSYNSSSSQQDAAAVLATSRSVLIAAVVLASIQFVSFIVTAALSSANRNTLRAEAHPEVHVLPMTAPQQLSGMEAGAKHWAAGFGLHDAPAKPITAVY